MKSLAKRQKRTRAGALTGAEKGKDGPPPARGSFVIRSADGLLWGEGGAWVDRLSEAVRFTGGADPWARAKELADSLARRGVACHVGYVPVRYC